MSYPTFSAAPKHLRLIILLLCLISTIVTPTQAAQTVRACDYVPGVSIPAVMPANLAYSPTLTPFPTEKPFTPTKVDSKTTALQQQVYDALWKVVNDHYVYTDFNDHDWNAIGARYQMLIKQGLSEDDFYLAMSQMIAELGDDHSYFESPKQVEDEKAEVASQYNFVGVGALLTPIEGTRRAAIMTVFPNSPAATAGLKPHD